MIARDDPRRRRAVYLPISNSVVRWAQKRRRFRVTVEVCGEGLSSESLLVQAFGRRAERGLVVPRPGSRAEARFLAGVVVLELESFYCDCVMGLGAGRG